MPESDVSFAEVFGSDDATVPTPSPGSAEGVDFGAVVAAAGPTIGARIATSEIKPRFDGDTGQLPAEVCWALQTLVAAPHVSESNKKHWPVIVQHEDVLRSRLSELNLVLEINLEHGFAFARQAEDPSAHARTILRPRPLSLIASALALYLYNQYVVAPEDPVVEESDMVDHLKSYMVEGDTDELGFDKRITAAIKTLEKAAVIKQVKGTRRYLVHGVITAILSAERVEALTHRYRLVAAGGAGGEEDLLLETDEDELEDGDE